MSACSDQAPALRIGTNLWVGYEPLYLARDIGALDERKARLVELPSATDVIHALQAGTLEAGALTLDETLLLRRRGMDVKILLILDYSAGADVLVAKPGVESLSDLAGRRVGFENTAVGALMLDAVLDAAGLAASAVDVVPLTPDQHLPAFSDGRVDAVVTYEPQRTAILNAGGRELFSSRSIPGRIVDVLVIRADVAERFPERVAHIERAWYRSLDYLEQSPGFSFERMARRYRVAPEALSAMLEGVELVDRDGNRKMLNGVSPPILDTAADLMHLMRERGLMEGAVGPLDGLLAQQRSRQ